MRTVSRRTFALVLTGAVSLFSPTCYADEKEDAIAAAKTVMAAVAENKFDLIWDTLASDRYKNEMGNTRAMFVDGLKIVREKIGRLTSSTVTYVGYNAPDPRAAFKGKSYSVMFENVYTTGTRSEGVLVMEENGQFKMSGLSLGT